MAALGETTDPGALLPGDPENIEEQAASLRKQGERFGTTEDDLRRVDTGNWSGRAGDAFWNTFSKEPPKWVSVCESVAATSEILTEYAGVLRHCQSRAAEAIALWEKGEAATREAVQRYRASASQAPFSDPGEQYRQQARELLTGARERLEAAGTHTAAAIRGDAVRPGVLDNLVNAVTEGWKAEGKAEVTGPTAGASASGPKGSKLGELKAFAYLAKASAQGSMTKGELKLSGKAEAFVGAETTASASFTKNGITGSAEAMVGAEASAAGKVEYGIAGLSGKAEAMAGAGASVSGTLSAKGLSLSGEAFAGAKVGVQGGADIGGIGISASAEGWAGAGASAGVDIGMNENGEFEIGAHAGAAVGLGGQLGFEITVDPAEVVRTATDAAEFVGDVASDAGELVGDAASSAWETATFWN